MKIEAITVCVNYSDFLAASLPVNRRQFDYMAVATDWQDDATLYLCARQQVNGLPFMLCEKGSGVFSKSFAINQVLEKLGMPDWVCVLDADVVLPLNFRETIMQCARVGALDPTCIYGIDRLMCRSYEAWTKYIGRLRHPDPRFVTTEDFPIGKRYSHFGRDGWAPMGFFQMWNPRGSGIRQYPEGDAMALCDLKFAQKWPRAKRVLLPEIVAVHLESEACEFGEKLARAKDQAVRGCAIRSPKFQHWAGRLSRRCGDYKSIDARESLLMAAPTHPWTPAMERVARARLVEIEAQACNLSVQFYGKLRQSEQGILLAKRIHEMNGIQFRAFLDTMRPELAKLKANLWEGLAPGKGAPTGCDSLQPCGTGKM